MSLAGTRIRWAAPSVLLILAACATQTPLPPPMSPVPGAPPTAAKTATPPAILPTSTPIPCFTRSELAGMALPDIAAHAILCFDSEDGIETEIAQADGIETIRTFLEDSTRVVGFREVAYMGNSPSGVLRVARFEDEWGSSYLVAVVAEKVLEMDPGASQPQPTGPALEQDELQTIAENLVRRELPAFDGLRDGLTFQAGAKGGGLNFFRWEQPGAASASGMPPLAQVGITDSGEVFSYINTLYFLQ